MGDDTPAPATVSDSADPAEAPPPVGGTWNRLYAIVLGELVLLVGLFYLFTRAFSP